MPKRPLPRLGVTVTHEMYEALEEESRRNFNAPISALVRQAVEEWLSKRGHDIEGEVTWGGKRRQEDEQGQRMAVATA